MKLRYLNQYFRNNIYLPQRNSPEVLNLAVCPAAPRQPMPNPCTNCYGKVALALCLQAPRSKNIHKHIKRNMIQLSSIKLCSMSRISNTQSFIFCTSIYNIHRALVSNFYTDTNISTLTTVQHCKKDSK
jgi:hypothetical protein